MQVLRNMFGAAHLMFNPSKATRHPALNADEGDIAVRQPRDDEYEFLLETPHRARRTKTRKPFDDLPERTINLIQRTSIIELVDEDADDNKPTGSSGAPIPLDFGRDGDEEDELLLKPAGTSGS